MSRNEDELDSDEEWFYSAAERIGRRPSAAQVESFCERVAIMMCDGKMSEPDARRSAFKAVIGD
ncbi:MAG: hypothetical protein ACXWAT_00810 [Methylobacter sp.]